MSGRINVRWDKRRGWHIGQQMEELDDDGVLIYGNAVVFTTVTAETEADAIEQAKARTRRALNALSKLPLTRTKSPR